MAGLAVFGCYIRFAFKYGLLLVYETYDRQRGGIGCADCGGVATKPSQEVIVHSDQGSQSGSDDWKRFCDANKMLPEHES